MRARTALICAADVGHTDTVRELIRADAALDAQDESGKTVLEVAKEKGHAEIVALLEDAEAGANSQ